ncbi:hypothetical protein BYT27DRAFT_7262398 [Phlegmacium glaucopus]|nr:hypothetical protein BYT27DRAFT_7262398 [Phlegmacium glaucopus]
MVPAQNLGPRMTLRFGDQYQVYETSRFQPGAQATPDTDVADIVGGQTVRFDEGGSYTITGNPEPGHPFHVQNGWRTPARIGVNNYDTSSNSFTSFFISPPVLLQSTSDLLPIKKFSVFWDPILVTNTMFDNTIVGGFAFDLTHNNNITLQYNNEGWSIVQ